MPKIMIEIVNVCTECPNCNDRMVCEELNLDASIVSIREDCPLEDLENENGQD